MATTDTWVRATANGWLYGRGPKTLGWSTFRCTAHLKAWLATRKEARHGNP